MRNLLDELHISQRQAEELIYFLGHIYSDIRQTSDREVTYSSSPEQTVTLCYDGAVLKEIKSHSLAELDRVKDLILENVLKDHGFVIARRVLFSSVPIGKHWCYNSWFQISPIPGSAPHAKAMLEPHPFILEFELRKTPDKLLEIYRRVRTAEEITLLLNAVSRHRIWMQPKDLEMKWFVANSDAGTQTMCGQEGYMEDGLTTDLDAFTEFVPESEIALVESSNYYVEPYFLGNEYSLPDATGSFFFKWTELGEIDRIKFLRSCRWLSHSFEISSTFRSAAYIALVNSIETLIPEVQGEKCPHCKRNIGPGPTKKFVDFIERYVPESYEVDKRALYSLRSSITHGGKLFHTDIDTFNLINPERFRQGTNMEALQRIVHIALNNWLFNA